jgi:hypothetical protein
MPISRACLRLLSRVKLKHLTSRVTAPTVGAGAGWGDVAGRSLAVVAVDMSTAAGRSHSLTRKRQRQTHTPRFWRRQEPRPVAQA